MVKAVDAGNVAPTEITEERIKLVFCFAKTDGDVTMSCAVKPSVVFEKPFKIFCEKKNIALKSVRPLMQGKRINLTKSLTELKMKPGSEVQIDVLQSQAGGSYEN
eukprot:Filipodium_phascolosomae@DN1297_c0_g1_i1.p1